MERESFSFKLKNMQSEMNFGTINLGVDPCVIWDMKADKIYLPDYDWLHDIENTKYQHEVQKYSEKAIASGKLISLVLCRFTNWESLLKKKLGTYSGVPIQLNESAPKDLAIYEPYFISKDK